MYLYAVFVLIALLTGCAELESMKGRGSVIPYAGVGDQNDNYSITAEGQNVPVNAWSHAGRTAHYAHFEFTGTVTIEITNKLGDFGPASISPKRFSISPTISGSKATFTLSTPRKLVVYAGGTRIFIFAEGPQTTPSQSDLLPGTLNTNHSLNYAGDTAPTSTSGPLTFLSNPLRGARMVGRGTYQRGNTVELYNLDNFRMEGVVYRQTSSNAWALIPRYLTNSVLSNVKILSQFGTTNTDGIDLDNSNNLLIEDVFVFSGDDSICLKGMPFRFPYGPAPTYGVPQPAVPVHDITVRNAVLLSTWNAMQFGPEDASDIYNVSFENIDVLEAYSGISVSAVTSLQNIHYNNVRIESTWSQIFMNVEHEYTTKHGTMYVDNLIVDQPKGISVTSYPQRLDIYFTNLTVAGRHIASLDDLQQVAGSANVIVSGEVGLHFDNNTSPLPAADTTPPAAPNGSS